jgi:acylpyruvate hydrolase
MRLATITTPHGPRAAVLRENEAVLVDGYSDVGALLRDGEAGMNAARRAHLDGDARPFTPEDVRQPILAPGAVVCVGLNYRTHILEMGRELPSEPTLFSKLPRALTDPYADVELPTASDRIDYEAELAAVIGTPGRDIALEDAWDHVAGLTVLNDVTARDYQRRTIQWFAGKTFQASTPIGPWLVTMDELADLTRRELRLTVNGHERQRARLDDLVFDIPTLVADLSRIVELQPGDIIATGTPGGVGEPQGLFLHDGDIVEVSIDGIGAIRNTFRTTQP